jgi:hypothetical protein
MEKRSERNFLSVTTSVTVRLAHSDSKQQKFKQRQAREKFCCQIILQRKGTEEKRDTTAQRE